MGPENGAGKAKEILDRMFQSYWNDDPPPGFEQRILRRVQRHFQAERRRFWSGTVLTIACAAVWMFLHPLNWKTGGIDQPLLQPEAAAPKLAANVQDLPSADPPLEAAEGNITPALLSWRTPETDFSREVEVSHLAASELEFVGAAISPSELGAGDLQASTRSFASTVSDLDIEPLSMTPASVVPLAGVSEEAGMVAPLAGGS